MPDICHRKLQPGDRWYIGADRIAEIVDSMTGWITYNVRCATTLRLLAAHCLPGGCLAQNLARANATSIARIAA